MYVCGITPYDATHLGHAATMITFDLVQRVWLDAGLPVRYVQNVTDIDDPLLERAARDGEDWVVLGDAGDRAVPRGHGGAADHPAGSTTSAPSSRSRPSPPRSSTLLDTGAAYRLDDGTGDVYFDITVAPRFGYESNLSREEMLELLRPSAAATRDRPGKRDPLDPLLWRGAREGEPSWPGGALGPGRPGWHIECAVIALDLLGDSIDVQGGGNDLLFPHHECSAAHAELLTGVTPFARNYVHAGMIGLDGEKMSKSKGNLVFVSRLRADRVDPMAVRLGLLAGHYRTDRAVDRRRCSRARQQRLARWREAAAAPAGPSGAAAAGRRYAERLADDLDAPGALARGRRLGGRDAGRRRRRPGRPGAVRGDRRRPARRPL